jgi:hypothetical protein
VDGPGRGEGALATLWAMVSFWSSGRGFSLGEAGMKTSTHPPMRPYEGDQRQDYKYSKAEASVIGPRRHDYDTITESQDMEPISQFRQHLKSFLFPFLSWNLSRLLVEVALLHLFKI